MNAAVRKGRELAIWVKAGPHRQGDGYVAGIYFFVTRDENALEEGMKLVEWALAEAVRAGGCGRHVVPDELVARAQVATLRKHLKTLPEVLDIFEIVMRAVSLDKRDADLAQMAVLVLERLFFEKFAPGRERHQALLGLRGQATDGKPGEIKPEPARQVLELFEEAVLVASFFKLSLPTLANALRLRNES